MLTVNAGGKIPNDPCCVCQDQAMADRKKVMRPQESHKHLFIATTQEIPITYPLFPISILHIPNHGIHQPLQHRHVQTHPHRQTRAPTNPHQRNAESQNPRMYSSPLFPFPLSPPLTLYPSSPTHTVTLIPSPCFHSPNPLADAR